MKLINHKEKREDLNGLSLLVILFFLSRGKPLIFLGFLSSYRRKHLGL